MAMNKVDIHVHRMLAYLAGGYVAQAVAFGTKAATSYASQQGYTRGDTASKGQAEQPAVSRSWASSLSDK
jgi:hypothetical protein